MKLLFKCGVILNSLHKGKYKKCPNMNAKVILLWKNKNPKTIIPNGKYKLLKISLKFTKKFQRNINMRKVNKTIRFDIHISKIDLSFMSYIEPNWVFNFFIKPLHFYWTFEELIQLKILVHVLINFLFWIKKGRQKPPFRNITNLLEFCNYC